MSDRAQLYNAQADKKPVNLSINRDLVEKAKALEINLSKTLENALIEIIRAEQKTTWVKENSEAIDEYNSRIAEDGVFSDGLRKF